MNVVIVLVRCAFTISIVVAAVVCQAAEPLQLVRSIPLHVEGRNDHLPADTAGERVFLAALGNKSLEVIDVKSGNVERSVSDLQKPQGIAFLKEDNLLAVATGDDGICHFFDTRSWEQVGSVESHEDSDNVRYDLAARRVYVGFGEKKGEGGLAVIDAAAKKRLADIDLGGHPESFQLEAKGVRIFANLPRTKQVVVIDRKKMSVIDRWPVDGERNFPMALDEADGRLIVGCRVPPVALVYDTKNGKQVDRFPIAGDTDDLYYDASRRRLYVCGGEGVVSVHQQGKDGKFTELARIPTAAGARTGIFAPDLNRLFVTVPHRGEQPSELREFKTVE